MKVVLSIWFSVLFCDLSFFLEPIPMAMAITPSLLSSPLLSSKSHHSFLSPFSQPHSIHRYTFLSVSCRQNLRPFAVNFNSQTQAIKAESSSATTEPMLPPYNVLITGSTKGQFLKLLSYECLFNFSFWCCSLSYDLGFLNLFLGFIYFGCFVGILCVIFFLVSGFGVNVWSIVLLCQYCWLAV